MTAADQSQAWMPPVVVPGPETSALARFHWDCAWTGTVEPNMMGAGSPRMAAVGRARFTWTADGLWLRGEFVQDQFIGDRLVLATTEDAPVRFRVTWDLTDPATPRWIDEVSVAGGPWQIVEQYVLTPSLPER